MALPSEQNTSFKHELERYDTGEIPRLDTVIQDVQALAARQTFNIVYLITCKGEHIIVNSRRHPRMKIVQAWITVSDNSTRPQVIEIIGLCKAQFITESYKAGVAIPLIIIQPEIHFIDAVVIKAASSRLITVNLLCESTEAQP